MLHRQVFTNSGATPRLFKTLGNAHQDKDGVNEQLTEAITLFQKDSKYRRYCYQQLQIEEPYKIINGLDKLAQDLSLETTNRTFVETDFSYLD